MTTQIQITHIDLSKITPSPLNPRKHFDEAAIIELAASIITKGVLQPILVRAVRGDKYEIVAGERRFRASGIAKQATIPCIIRALNEEEALDIMIIENLQRKDIHPMEEANGFKQIMDIKHIDVKEIAARVGKDVRYVAQRLHLTRLIDVIQQHFFNGQILVKDALTIATFSVDDQRELYIDQLEDTKGVFSGFSAWELRKYRNKLRDASFDITDTTIIPLAGACTTCPFNSACQPLLFQEMSTDPVCQRPECFKDKTEISFAAELVRASEDPGVVLITSEYTPEKQTKELMKKHEGILLHSQYSEMNKPEYPDRENYEGDNDTEEEDEQDFQKAVGYYEKEMTEFNAKIERGGFIKAFKIGGDEKGQYCWIKLNKGHKAAANGKEYNVAQAASDGSDDIKSEIQRIKDREKRAIELDDAKIWDQVKVKFDPINNIKDFTDHNLTQVELTAAAYAIFNKLQYDTKDKVRKFLCGPTDKKAKIDAYFSSITQLGVNQLLRVFLLDTLPPTAIYGAGLAGDAAVMMKVAEAYWPNEIQSICTSQHEIAEKRAARVAKKIADLDTKLKSIKKETTAAKKKVVTDGVVKPATAKGKGVKALIPLILLFLFTCCTHTAEQVLPICSIVTTRQVGDKLHLKIHSSSPYVILRSESGHEMRIIEHYYNCTSLAVDPGEVLTIIDGVEECQIITSTTDHQI